MSDVWLDVEQAAALLGIAAPRFERLIAAAAIPTRLAPSGRAGVMKSDLLAWHRADRDARRDALRRVAALADREIFR